MYRFVPVLLILALALGACGHKKNARAGGFFFLCDG